MRETHKRIEDTINQTNKQKIEAPRGIWMDMGDLSCEGVPCHCSVIWEDAQLTFGFLPFSTLTCTPGCLLVYTKENLTELP